MCFEHGVTRDGQAEPLVLDDRKDVFFYESDDNRYVPRAVLFDLEQSSISRILNEQGVSELFPPESIFDNYNGEISGAGNRWSSGYKDAEKNKDTFREMLRREAENCDALESIALWHSLAGGTGSGLGSYIIEQVADTFPKQIVVTHSVLPNRHITSEVVVQNYNTLLAAQRLTEHADIVMLYDNEMLHQTGAALNAQIAQAQAAEQTRGFDQANARIATAAAGITAGMRFPEYSSLDYTTLAALLVPVPKLHFLTPSITPLPPKAEIDAIASAFPTQDRPSIARHGAHSQPTLGQTLSSLLDSQHRLVDFSRPMPNAMEARDLPVGTILSAVAMVSGPHITHSELYNSLSTARTGSQQLHFARWGPPNFQAILQRRSPKFNNDISGVMVTNNTGVRHTFEEFMDGFNRMWVTKVRPYFDPYKSDIPDAELYMEEAAESMNQLIQQYAASELPDFLNSS